jgi:hypothetical protein
VLDSIETEGRAVSIHEVSEDLQRKKINISATIEQSFLRLLVFSNFGAASRPILLADIDFQMEACQERLIQRGRERSQRQDDSGDKPKTLGTL